MTARGAICHVGPGLAILLFSTCRLAGAQATAGVHQASVAPESGKEATMTIAENPGTLFYAELAGRRTRRPCVPAAGRYELAGSGDGSLPARGSEAPSAGRTSRGRASVSAR